jgi:predicted nucleotidyltransferase
MSIFDGLITSKMRVQILMRLFFNPKAHAYIRELAEEFDASPSQVRDELNKLSSTGLLHTEKQGRQINFAANQDHPLYPELHSMVKKALGMDRIVESVVERLGNVERVILHGDYAQGKDSGLIDLVLVGDIDRKNLEDLVSKTEKYISRKIRTLVLDSTEYKKMLPVISGKPRLVLWESGAGPN